MNFGEKRKIYSKCWQKIVQKCQSFLNQNSEVQQYLKGRLLDYSSFGFGYFPPFDSWDKEDQKLLENLNLVYWYDQMPITTFEEHPLVWPYLDLYGNYIGLMGRSILSEEARTAQNSTKDKKITKYKYARGPNDMPFKKSLHLFGLNLAKQEILKQNQVYLVEGQIDMISCFQHGLKNVVSLGGTTLTKYQFNLLCRYTDHLILLLDNDKEGQKAMEKIQKRYSELKISKCLLPSDIKDIDQFLRQGGKIESLGIDG